MTPAPKKKEKHLGPRVDVLSIRWRELLPEQRQAVTTALAREFKRLCRLAQASRAKGDRPEPYGAHHRNRAIWHSCNAGAVKISRDFLREIGGFP